MNDPSGFDDPPDSLIPYDEIVQECLRGVVRRVLGQVEASGGLPGGHHFFIAFRTRHPGVEMPRHLAERYPEEMTIVLQHKFWDLAVHEQHFEVGLTFNQVPAKLSIPYNAVSGFVDPSVNFALQFAVNDIKESPPSPPCEKAGEDQVAVESNVVSLDFRKRRTEEE